MDIYERWQPPEPETISEFSTNPQILYRGKTNPAQVLDLSLVLKGHAVAPRYRKQALLFDAECSATPRAVSQNARASTLSATIWAFVPDHTSAFMEKLAHCTYPHTRGYHGEAFKHVLPHHAATHWRTAPSHRKCAQLRTQRLTDVATLFFFFYSHCRSQTDASLDPWPVTPQGVHDHCSWRF